MAKDISEVVDNLHNERTYDAYHGGSGYKRNLKLQGMYGIDAEKWNEMFLQQNGCCKICNRHQTEFKNKLSVDHCHKTGKVRGLLCNDCNRGLGAFKDNTELIKIAINYLNEN
jgi:hypothetical protein